MTSARSAAAAIFSGAVRTTGATLARGAADDRSGARLRRAMIDVHAQVRIHESVRKSKGVLTDRFGIARRQIRAGHAANERAPEFGDVPGDARAFAAARAARCIMHARATVGLLHDDVVERCTTVRDRCRRSRTRTTPHHRCAARSRPLAHFHPTRIIVCGKTRRPRAGRRSRRVWTGAVSCVPAATSTNAPQF